MNIIISSAIGRGTTELGAFDNALAKTGTTNYNLIRLSSVIPPGTNIILDQTHVAKSEDFGKRLYCVYSEMCSATKGTAIGSIIGYYQFDDGRGLFVEHELSGNDEAQLRNDLIQLAINSLSDLCRTRNFPVAIEKFKLVYKTATVDDAPLCSLVMAIYKIENW